MSRRKNPNKLAKVTLNLFEDDWDFLKSVHTKLGAGQAVRLIVQSHVGKLRETIAERQAAPKLGEVELDV